MEVLVKTAAVCLPAALFAAVLKKDNPVMSLLIAVAAGCVILYSSLGAVTDVADFLRDVADETGVSQTILGVLLKIVGIAIMARLSSDLCRDAGLTTAATAAELAGSTAALYISLPVMRTVLQMIRGLVG